MGTNANAASGGDDLLFDLEEGSEHAMGPEATLTSFTGSQSKPLPLSYGMSPERPQSPTVAPHRKQLGTAAEQGSLFSAGSWQDSQDSALPGRVFFVCTVSITNRFDLIGGPCCKSLGDRAL